MRLMLEEVIMSDRHMWDGQICSFLQLFFNAEKISLNWRLDSTVTDYVLLIFIVKPLWLITSILMQLNHKLCRTDNNLTSLQRNIPSLQAQFLQQISYKKYWDKLLKNTSHQDQSCTLCQCQIMVLQISSKSYFE